MTVLDLKKATEQKKQKDEQIKQRDILNEVATLLEKLDPDMSFLLTAINRCDKVHIVNSRHNIKQQDFNNLMGHSIEVLAKINNDLKNDSSK